MMTREPRILLVEDNPGDVRLTIEALREGEVRSDLQIVPDGLEAMAYLRQEGKYATAARPDLILLDLNLPKKDGREVLRELKADVQLKQIPVVVLTSSRAAQDVAASYELNANCFVTKPSDLMRLIDVYRSIANFWLNVATLPNE